MRLSTTQVSNIPISSLGRAFSTGSSSQPDLRILPGIYEW